MLAEYETVFVKDMAYYLVNRLDTPAYIPDNYIHAFLLRDPHKSVYSLYKMSLNKDLTGNVTEPCNSVVIGADLTLRKPAPRIRGRHI